MKAIAVEEQKPLLEGRRKPYLVFTPMMGGIIVVVFLAGCAVGTSLFSTHATPPWTTLAMASSSSSSLPAFSDIELSNIRQRAAREWNWDDNEALKHEAEYRRFLQLHALFPSESLTPSPAIDHLWHHHILWTQQYSDDCARLFGSYMHHQPESDLTSKKSTKQPMAGDQRLDGYIRTMELYRQAFRTDPPVLSWPADGTYTGVVDSLIRTPMCRAGACFHCENPPKKPV